MERSWPKRELCVLWTAEFEMLSWSWSPLEPRRFHHKPCKLFTELQDLEFSLLGFSLALV